MIWFTKKRKKIKKLVKTNRVYIGETLGNLPHGKGVYYKHTEKFEGEFRYGIPHGYGTYYTCSGEEIRGKWKYGMCKKPNSIGGKVYFIE